MSTFNAIAARTVVVTAGLLGFAHVFWAVFWSVRVFGAAGYTASEAGLWLAWLMQTGVGGGFCVLGAFIASRAGTRPGVWTLGGYLVAQGLATGYLNSIVDVFGFFDPRPQAVRLLVNGLAYSAALRAVQLFPRPLSSDDVTSLIKVDAPSRFVWQPVRWFLTPWRVWALAAAILALVPLTPSDLLFHVGQLTVIVLVVATMAANYLTGSIETRKKIYWLLAGALVLLLGRIVILAGHLAFGWLGIEDVTVASGATIPVVSILRIFAWAVATLGMMTCVLLAVFYTGAISPELVVRRTAVYSLGVGILVFTFGVFVNYVSAVVVEILVLEQTLVEAIAATLIALTFKPLNDLLTRFADRVLPKRLPSTPDGVDGPPPPTSAAER